MGLLSGSGRAPGVENGNPLSILAWKIAWSEKPGRPQSMGHSQTWLSGSACVSKHCVPVSCTLPWESQPEHPGAHGEALSTRQFNCKAMKLGSSSSILWGMVYSALVTFLMASRWSVHGNTLLMRVNRTVSVFIHKFVGPLKKGSFNQGKVSA